MNIRTLIQTVASHSLAKNSAIVFVGSMLANIGAYAYHLLMGRFLGPSGYGELSSLLSLLYIFTVPLTVGQTVLVKFISGFKARGSVGQSKSLLYAITQWFMLAILMGLPIVLVLSSRIGTFLHLVSPAPFLQVYAIFAISLLSVATASVLLGYQMFFWASIIGLGTVLVKIALSVPLVKWGVSGVLWASIASGALMYLVYVFPLRFVIAAKGQPTKLGRRDALRFAIPTFFTLLGITSLYSTDIVLVRHYFTASDAGLYAALAVLGKIIFYASSSVAMVLFPVLSERIAVGRNTIRLTWAAIAGVTVVSSALVALYFLFPDFIVGLLFGRAFAGAGALLGMFGIFLALFSIGNVIVTACLAIGKTGIWIIPMACAIVQAVAITWAHGSIATVIMLNIAVCALFVAAAGGYHLLVTHEKV